jgi:hypothetical protein
LLTEREFARRSGLSARSVRRHACIPRIASPLGLGPAYPAFMLDTGGLRLDVAFVTLLLRRRVPDLVACDWLVRRNTALGGRAPLAWIGSGRPLEAAIEALPVPETARAPRQPQSELEAIREEWLRFRGDDPTPGWTIAWDRIARRARATPHGI